MLPNVIHKTSPSKALEVSLNMHIYGLYLQISIYEGGAEESANILSNCWFLCLPHILLEFLSLHFIKDILFALCNILKSRYMRIISRWTLLKCRKAIGDVQDHRAQYQVFTYSFIQHICVKCSVSARLYSRHRDTAVAK